MKFKKQGVGLLWIGVILMFLTFYPAYVEGIVPSIVAHVAGWVMIIAGAVIRGRQVKNQKQVENAIYEWAKNSSGAAPSSGPAGPAPAQSGNSFCPHCGAPTAGNFCANCGARLR